MQIYLPIAEVSVNIFLLIGLGGMVGILSGMFGVGGGFILTPFLFFIGIPPAVAVATGANQIVASSFSGVRVFTALAGAGAEAERTVSNHLTHMPGSHQPLSGLLPAPR